MLKKIIINVYPNMTDKIHTDFGGKFTDNPKQIGLLRSLIKHKFTEINMERDPIVRTHMARERLKNKLIAKGKYKS